MDSKNYPFKSATAALIVMAVLLVMAACGYNSNSNSRVLGTESEIIYGYIKDCNQQARTITVDEVELITSADTNRVNQLGLRSSQFTNGYYVHNPAVGHTMYAIDSNIGLYFDAVKNSSDTQGTSGNGSAGDFDNNKTTNNNINTSNQPDAMSNNNSNDNHNNNDRGYSDNGTADLDNYTITSNQPNTDNNSQSNTATIGSDAAVTVDENNVLRINQSNGDNASDNTQSDSAKGDTNNEVNTGNNSYLINSNDNNGSLGDSFATSITNNEAAGVQTGKSWEEGFAQLWDEITGDDENNTLYRLTVTNGKVTAIRNCNTLLGL